MGDHEVTIDPLPAAPKPPRRDPGWGGTKGDPDGCGCSLSIEQAHAALDERGVPRGAPLADRVLRYFREETRVEVAAVTTADVMRNMTAAGIPIGDAEQAVTRYLHPSPYVAQ